MGIRPISESHPVTQYFGTNPGGNNPSGGHTGTDYGAPTGTPIVAIADGTVIFAGPGSELPGDDSAQGWAQRLYLVRTSVGNGVITEHDDVYTTNSHMSRVAVKYGDKVKQGQIIGYVGDTGLSYGSHLHFEIIPKNPNWGNGIYGRIDPGPYTTEKHFMLSQKATASKEATVSKAYKFETKWTTKNQVARSFYGNFGPKPTGITLHHWGNDGQKFDDVAHFLSTNNTPTSAHYVVEDGRIACLASPEVATYHAGNATGNGSTVGIELRPEMTKGDVDTAVQLIYELESTYGSLTIYQHKDWYNTACPGRWGAKIPEIINRVNAMHKNGGKDPGLSTSTTSKPSSPPKNETQNKGNNMALSDADVKKIVNALLDEKIARKGAGKGTVTLREALAYEWDNWNSLRKGK